MYLSTEGTEFVKKGNNVSESLSRINWSTKSNNFGMCRVKGVNLSFNSGKVFPFIQDLTLAVIVEDNAWSLLVLVK